MCFYFCVSTVCKVQRALFIAELRSILRRNEGTSNEKRAPISFYFCVLVLRNSKRKWRFCTWIHSRALFLLWKILTENKEILLFRFRFIRRRFPFWLIHYGLESCEKLGSKEQKKQIMIDATDSTCSIGNKVIGTIRKESEEASFSKKENIYSVFLFFRLTSPRFPETHDKTIKGSCKVKSPFQSQDFFALCFSHTASYGNRSGEMRKVLCHREQSSDHVIHSESASDLNQFLVGMAMIDPFSRPCVGRIRTV